MAETKSYWKGGNKQPPAPVAEDPERLSRKKTQRRFRPFEGEAILPEMAVKGKSTKKRKFTDI